jgi:hypothetical protein
MIDWSCAASADAADAGREVIPADVATANVTSAIGSA